MFHTQVRQKALSVMPEWRVTNVMAQGYRFDKVLIELQEPAYGSCNPGNQLDVENAMSYVIVVHKTKYLSLVDISYISPGVKDTVSIKCKLLSITPSLLRVSSDALGT